MFTILLATMLIIGATGTLFVYAYRLHKYMKKQKAENYYVL